MRRFSKPQSTCLGKQFERNFFKKWRFSDEYCTSSEIFFIFGQNNLAWCCQNCIRCVQKNILRNFFWRKDDFLVIFELWAKKFRTFAKTYGRVSKITIYVSRETFCGKKVGKKDGFFIFRTFEKYLAGVSKIAFCVSRGTFWGNENCWKSIGFVVFFVPSAKIFRTSSKKIFELLAKKLRRVFQNLILRVQVNNLRKNFFENDVFLVFFLSWAKTFRHLGEKF